MDGKIPEYEFTDESSGVSLFQMLEERSFVPLSEREVDEIFKHLALALDYNHSKGVSHGDIKLDTIFMQSQQPKLIRSGTRGSPKLRRRNSEELRMDVADLGAVLYCLLFGFFPVSSTHSKNNIQLAFPSSQVSQGLKDLLRKMLQPEGEKRYTIKKVMEDSYFQNHINVQ